MKLMPRIFLIYTVLFFLIGFPCMAFELPDGVVTAGKLNVRRREDINSSVFWLLKKGDHVKVKVIKGDWCKVVLPGGKAGFVHHKYLDIMVWARVLDGNAQAYNRPDTTAEVTGALKGIAWIRATNRSQSWIEVEFTNGERAWVSRGVLEVPDDFFSSWLAFRHTASPATLHVSEKPVKTQSRGTVVTQSTKNALPVTTRSKIVEFARRYMGTPYLYGGESLAEGGFDCSGFVYFVYSNFGVKLERVSRNQATMGTRIDKEALKHGDLVFFDTRTKPKGIVNHAGIYIGNGQFIHSSSSKKSPYVTISSLADGFYSSHYIVGRRVID